MPRLVTATACFLLLSCTAAFGQQLVFTSRLQPGSPVVLSAAQESKTFGYESVELWNDGADPVRAVRLRVTFRTDRGDEITDDRVFMVSLESRERKSIVVDLGHVEGLRQKAKSSGQKTALAILTIASIEFRDGTLWEEGASEEAPFDPAR